MTVGEIAKIKEYQRDFYEKFNKKLIVDFPSMNGSPKSVAVESKEKINKPTLKRVFEHCVKKHNADATTIRQRDTMLRLSKHQNEKSALKDFCKLVFKYELNVENAAEMINRHRSCVYHYAGYKKRK